MPSKKMPVLTPKDELKLVKKILKRDYLVNLADAVARSRQNAIGVEAEGSVHVPKALHPPISVVFQNAPFDSSGFLPGGAGPCLTVPAGLEGRYDLVVSVRWWHLGDMAPGETWTLEESQAGYFYTQVHVNGVLCSNPLRHTANATVDAIGTTQNFSWHLNLSAGDTVELLVLQDVYDGDARADTALCMARIGAV